MIQNSGQTGFESEGLGSTVGFEAYTPIGLGFFRFSQAFGASGLRP